MNVWLAMLAVVLALDLPQRARALDEWPARLVGLAAALTWLAVLAFSVLATPLLDVADVSGPTMQVGAALVLVLWSVWMLFRWDTRPVPTRVPGEVGTRDAIVPGAAPVLITPVVGVITVAVAARRGVVVASVPALVALAVLPIGRAHLARRSLRQLAAVAGIVVGVALMVDGILDV